MGKSRRSRSPGSSSTSSPANTDSVQKTFSRGQRKRALRRASLVKKIGVNATSQGAEGNDEEEDDEDVPPTTNLPSQSVDGGHSLPGMATQSASTDPRPTQPTFQRVVSNKGKKTLMAAEMRQLNAVLDAPSFQKDPLAAIQAHLRQTTAPISTSTENPKVRGGTKAKTPKRGLNRSQQSRENGGGKNQASKPYKGRHAKMKMKR